MFRFISAQESSRKPARHSRFRPAHKAPHDASFVPPSLALLLLIAAPALAQRSARRPGSAMPTGSIAGSDIARDPAWRFGTLPNGLHYAVRRNALPAGQVSIRVRIDAGSLHEADNERGWAHFLEHMLFRGTADLSGPPRAGDLAAARRELRLRHQCPHRRDQHRLCAEPAPRRARAARHQPRRARRDDEPGADRAGRGRRRAAGRARRKGPAARAQRAHQRDRPAPFLCRPALCASATRSARTRR